MLTFCTTDMFLLALTFCSPVHLLLQRKLLSLPRIMQYQTSCKKGTYLAERLAVSKLHQYSQLSTHLLNSSADTVLASSPFLKLVPKRPMPFARLYSWKLPEEARNLVTKADFFAMVQAVLRTKLSARPAKRSTKLLFVAYCLLLWPNGVT